MRKKKKRILVLILATMLVLSGGTAAAVAYLTGSTPETKNTFSVGDVDVTIKETFTPPDGLVAGENIYTKTVWFKNSGSVPAYARAAFCFSDENVAEITYLSSDGNTWYPSGSYDEHLPEGWIKGTGSLEGYYYYTQPLDPGGITTPLFSYVKTVFAEKTADTNETINYTPRDYDIYVYVEGVQQSLLDGSGMNASYEEAWIAFLAKKGGA